MAVKPFTGTVLTVTTSGTRVACAKATQGAGFTFFSSLTFQADPANTGNIYIGDSTVTAANGIQLQPGQSVNYSSLMRGGSTDEFAITDFFVNADANSQVCRISGVVKKA